MATPNHDFTACTEADRIGDEPVGLPPRGEPVATVRYVPRPRPSAEVEAQLKAAEEAIRAGKAPVVPPASPLEYTRTPVVEMTLGDPCEGRQDIGEGEEHPRDHVHEDGWQCGLFPVNPDRVPTHWAPLPKLPR